MPNHKVDVDEWIGSIAAKYGHASWRKVWSHPKNSGLRSKRKDPNLLMAGDVVFVPPGPDAASGVKTGGKREFSTAVKKDSLVIRFVDFGEYVKAFGPIDFTLTLGESVTKGKIESEGQTLTVPLEMSVAEGSLDIFGGSWALMIGGLAPLETTAGQQARMANLGWDCGPVDNAPGPKTRRGTRAFQKHEGLKVDGIIGSRTRGALKKAYGC